MFGTPSKNNADVVRITNVVLGIKDDTAPIVIKVVKSRGPKPEGLVT